MAASKEKRTFEEQRKQKLESIREMGIEPYGNRYEDTEPAEGAKERYKTQGTGQTARCAGRVALLRDIGKLIFITLRDFSGTIQLGLSKKLIEQQWELAKLLDTGDIIGAEGQLGETKTGEITIWASRITLLSKCLLNPPEKFHGLADTDLRYRRRYLDLWVNPEVMETFKARISMVTRIRDFLKEQGYLEVETPMMQTIPGGAAAKPFVTHHNSLDMDLFLRISPELFLKRLLVGGMEKVFEINRNFRNEGLSREHNPEFTMLELYQAYADYNVMMDLTEELISECVEKFCKGGTIRFDNREVDLGLPWPRRNYAELLKEYSGCGIDDIKGLRKKAVELGLDEENMDDVVVVDKVFEITVEDKLTNPTFVIDYPSELCPLTRECPDDSAYAERFELFIAGMEIANAYTELNDPQIQEAKFRKQLRGQEASMARMDDDFITALKYGMPPAGGLGIGVDRLVMVLTSSGSIRDVVLFPLLKPVDKKQS